MSKNNIFVWNEDYETKLEEVDEQHKYLVDQVNILSEKLLEDSLTFEDFDSVLEKIVDYTVFHFSHEEKVMQTAGVYQEHVEKHKESHNFFVEEIKGMYSEISKADFNLENAKNLRDFLVNWVAFHILEEDKEFSKQIFLIRKGKSPKEAYEKVLMKKEVSTRPLVKALKGLMDVLRFRNKELKNLKSSLEMKIQERTRELRRANKILEQISMTDQLTGLSNRRYALKVLNALWEESLMEKSQLSCLMIDADHFKDVNDTFGHDAGDKVLKKIARSLLDSVRTDDIVCRLGGDEFFIICPNTDLKGGIFVAKNILKTVNELKIPLANDQYYNGSLSIGLACSTGIESIEELIKEADRYVYVAKRDGKNCIRYKEVEKH